MLFGSSPGEVAIIGMPRLQDSRGHLPGASLCQSTADEVSGSDVRGHGHDEAEDHLRLSARLDGV